MCVVSGLARGIDAAAHAGALSAGGRTIAVLGSGLACVYPPEHLELAAEIAVAGAVVSQWWPWTPPAPEQFRRRNAVSSGLALATVVVEASARSGARLQARLARSQGRLLCVSEAVAASEDWARVLVSASSAVVVRGAEDVLGALNGGTWQDYVLSGFKILPSSRSRPDGLPASSQLSLDIG